MNRTLILLLVVTLLGAGAYFFIGKDGGKPTSSVVGADREFAVPRDQVYKIFLADRNENNTTLTRTKDGWLYDGQYKVRPDAMENLLLAVENLRMRFKPTEAATPHLITSLSGSQALKVEIYGKNDEKLKTYYLGGATNDELGTYIIMEGSNQPYVADIPHWQGNIRFRYSLMGDDWRDRKVFGSKANNIAEVSVEYPKQQDQSFRLDMTGDQPKIMPFYPLSPTINKPIRQGATEAFLSNFSNVIAVSFNNLNKDREEIVQQIPFSIITLKEKSGKEYSITLFPLNGDPFYDPKTGVTTVMEETTAFHALTQDNDFMVMQNVVLRKILWGYDFFF